MVSMENNTNVQKKKGLDILRGIGITGIVLFHLFPSVFRGGFLGVPLFFVLSGYLMFVSSNTCYEKGNFSVLNYYKKRVIKILPPLFAMVMIVCCYLTLFHSSQMIGIRREICSIFLGYDNWWQIQQNTSYFSAFANNSPFTHLWFLAIEIQFYIIWPFLFLLYKKGCKLFGGRILCFSFLLLALISAGRMLFLYVPGADPSRVYYGTDTMSFPLFIGMFLGAVRQEYKGLSFAIKKKWADILFLLFVGILGVLFMTVDGQYDFVYQGGMFAISLFFATIIHLLENQEKEAETEKMPEISLMSLLGKESYWIYLWHYPIIMLALL